VSGGDEKTSNLPTAPPSSENSVDKPARLRRFAAALKAASRDRAQPGALENPQAEASEPGPCGTGVGILHEPGERIFALAAPLMLARGWSVWPQERDGRRMPSRVGDFPVEWGKFRDRRPDDAEMAAFCRDAPAANVAIALGEASGRAFAVDVDCLDPEVSARVQEIAFEALGRTPLVRIGRAPKVALLYRYADGPPPSSSHRFDGREGCALEILGHLKPLTMWGRHHSTSQWFRWPDANPLMVGSEAAPAVDRAAVAEFLRAVEAEFPFERKAAARAATLGPGTVGRAAGDGDIVVPRREGPKLTDGREAHLRDLAWAAVRLNGRMLLAAHAAGGLDEAARAVVAAVCRQFEEDCEMSEKWAGGLAAKAEARVGSAVLKLVSGEMTPAPEAPPEAAPSTKLAGREFDTSRFLEPPPPRKYALHGLPVGKVGLLVSAGGTGKSTLALGLAASFITGRNLFGLLPADPPRGKVLYVSVEDDAERVWEVMRHLDEAAGGAILGMPDFPGMFRLLALDEVGFSIGTWKQGFDVVPSGDMRELAAIMAEGRPALTILDTLNRSLGGLLENDNNAMAGAIGILERAAKPAGSAFLVLHHASKAAALGGMGDVQQAARGAGAIADNSRWVSNLTGMTEEEAQAEGVPEDQRWEWVRWTNSKANGVRPFGQVWLRRAKGGVLVAARTPGRGRQGILNRVAEAQGRRKKREYDD